MLTVPLFTLTFYPAAYPSTADALVLQSASHYLDGQVFLPVQVEQAVQVAEFVRGAVPDFFNRGNRATTLQWTEVRRYASPSGALAASFELAEAMPDSTGWLRIDLPDEGRAWAVTPCAIRMMAGRPEKAGAETLLKVTWTLLCGVLSEIAAEVPEEDYLLFENGFTVLCEDGSELALESYT